VSGFGSIPELVRFIYGRVNRGIANSIVPQEWRRFAPPP
jgi:hypothetical protein